MRPRLSWLILGVVVVVAAYAVTGLATPSSGFTGTTLAVGRFGEIDVRNFALPADPWQARPKTHGEWRARLKTHGASDLYVQSNVWAPGGTTGWHTHPGHSLIIVTAGTVTVYDGDDANCLPHAYSQGMGFVDPGGDHAHVIRNEGTVEARTTTVQLIPALATRRIDVPDPGHCGF